MRRESEPVEEVRRMRGKGGLDSVSERGEGGGARRVLVDG